MSTEKSKTAGYDYLWYASVTIFKVKEAKQLLLFMKAYFMFIYIKFVAKLSNKW